MESKLFTSLQKYVLKIPTDLSSEESDDEFVCHNCGKKYKLPDDTGPCCTHTDYYVLRVPTIHMGLVMGRGGQTIDKIQRLSGARLPDVQRKKTGQGESIIQIQGGPDQVKKAEGMIHTVLRFKARVSGGVWRCCGAAGADSVGCVVQQHCVDRFYTDPKQVIATVYKGGPGKVFALDCKTCLTAQGREVARVTILGYDGSVCYDSLVKPSLAVGDHRTNYTGITPSTLAGISKSIKDVQAEILELVAAEDIIICHTHTMAPGEALKALHIIHNNIIDTSNVFPHRDGPHNKSHIRFLANNYLGRTIQDNESLFDYKEDALAVLDLMKTKQPI